jgi:hypothetical protein
MLDDGCAMMDLTTIDPAMLDDATADEARERLRPLVAEARTNPDAANALHAVLHHWSWQAIDQRRRDVGLQQWETLLTAVSTAVAEARPELAAAIRQMKAFLREAIAAANLLSADHVIQRAHVPQLLAALTVDLSARSPWVLRTSIESRLGLGSPNLTRVINLAVAAKLVERRLRADGRSAELRLTALGADRLKSWQADEDLDRVAGIMVQFAPYVRRPARYCGTPPIRLNKRESNTESTFGGAPVPGATVILPASARTG